MTFLVFLEITSDTAIMTSPLKIFKMCGSIFPTLWSKPKSKALLLNADKRSKILKFVNFFVKIYDFSFYNVQHTFLRLWSGRCTVTHFKNFQWGGLNSFFKRYSQKTKKVTYFQTLLLYSFSHILQITSPPLLIFIPHILEHVYCILEQTLNFYHY